MAASIEQLCNIVLGVKNRDEIDRLVATFNAAVVASKAAAASEDTYAVAVQAGASAAARFSATVKDGTAGVYGFADAAAVTGKEWAKTTTVMVNATSAADKLDPAMAKISKSSTGMANAIQGGSRAFQDFTSAAMNGGALQGLNAITNNVDQVVMGFSTLAGAAPDVAVKIASFTTAGAVTLQLLIPVIKSVAESFGWFKPEIDKTKSQIDSLKDKVKELTDKPLKLQVDRNELAAAEADLKRMTKALDAYNEAKGLKSKLEHESESGVKGIFAESGGEALAALEKLEKKKADSDPALKAARDKIAALRKNTEDLNAEEKADTGLFGTGFLKKTGFQRARDDNEAKIKEIEDQLPGARESAIDQAKRNAGATFKGATSAEGGSVATGNAKLAEDLVKAGRPDLAKMVQSKAPKAIEAQNESDAEGEAMGDEAIESGKAASANLAKKRAKQKVQVDEAVGGLAKWAEGQILHDRDLTADDIAKALEDSGVERADDTDFVSAVIKGVRERYRKSVTAHALGMGGEGGLEAARDAMRDKADAPGERKENTAQGRINAGIAKFDAADAKQAADHKAAVGHAGAFGARTYGGAVKGDVMGMLAGTAPDDVFANSRANVQVQGWMRSNGALGEDGRPMNREAIAEAARIIVQQARIEASKQNMGVAPQGRQGGARNGRRGQPRKLPLQGAKGSFRSMPAAPPGAKADPMAGVVANQNHQAGLTGGLASLVGGMVGEVQAVKQRLASTEAQIRTLMQTFNNAINRGR